ncbi:MAG: bifunctional methylenetetrahydrofolate dehydrogenase/methenyltetrahydrofolate cyclohydrolase FolD [Myxococcales bacterium]|nr:bifunctional methylenetetrahydrofolate dehydrogenase/methenyltetrahydrofolate cyclohydrolase FolD [Myxococcales bacterium]
MSARALDGKALGAALLEEVRGRVVGCEAHGVTPTLAVVLVGEDPASAIYVRNKSRRAEEVGIITRDHRLAASTGTASLLALVRELGDDRQVDGILVQLPLPGAIETEKVLFSLDPAKDVDGFHPDNLGRLMIGRPRFVPCTPQGCMRLLSHGDVELRGKRALVIGRSMIVGRPMAQLLLSADATVISAHSRTSNLRAEVEAADVVIAAVGRANLVRGAWVKPGAAIIDVGMNRDEAGKLCGDVEFAAAAERASVVTPVPGGVGPMTIACLLENTLDAALARRA